MQAAGDWPVFGFLPGPGLALTLEPRVLMVDGHRVVPAAPEGMRLEFLGMNGKGWNDGKSGIPKEFAPLRRLVPSPQRGVQCRTED